MLKNGVLRNDYDRRDFSFERSFGAVSLLILPDEYNSDLGISMPDQNALGMPNGCTGMTQNDTGQDEYGVEADPRYVYQNTLLIEGKPDGSPCNIRNSFKATSIYGLKGTDGADPLTRRRGKYFDVDKVGDYFDGARSALWQNRLHKRTLSCGTPWYKEWRSTKNGVLPTPKDLAWKAGVVGHNYKICGWKLIGGNPHLIVKPWLGEKWGDGGYGYVSRETFNKIMSQSGMFLYVQANYTPDFIETVRLDIYELILTLCRRLLKEKTEAAPVKPKEDMNQKIYEYALSCLGKDKAPRENEYGCAESLYYVLKEAGVEGLPSSAIYSTIEFQNWLLQHAKEVDEAMYGDVIISATRGENTGHTGIVGKNSIMSNNSLTALWDDHWTLPKWKDYYTAKKGLSTRFFRLS